jgi:hypothetical protein
MGLVNLNSHSLGWCSYESNLLDEMVLRQKKLDQTIVSLLLEHR